MDSTKQPQTIHGKFEEVWREQPTSTAVIGPDGMLTFDELRVSARILAARLCEAGVRPGQPVPLITDRSTKGTIGLLGILYAGAAYVPIAADETRYRIWQLLEECGRSQVVVVSDDAQDVPFGITAFAPPVSSFTASDSLQKCVDVPTSSNAVVIFTSGSSGRPKGVVLSHRAVLARFRNGYQWRRNDLQRASLSTSAHISDFLVPLLSGGTTIIVAERSRTHLPAFCRDIFKHRPSRLVMVPSMLRAMLESHELVAAVATSVDTIIVSGETLSPIVAERCLERLPQVTLMNAYGASEVAGLATGGTITVADDIHVGVPVHEMIIDIRDDAGRPVDRGTAGEVYLGGPQVASGYLHPEQGASRFVHDDQQEYSLFRTGDLGVLAETNELRILGRKDHEYKVRGFRVHASEVEGELETSPGVVRAVVLAFYDPDTRLHALIEGNGAADVNAVRTSLRLRVPDYMVPHRLDIVDKLPLLPGGKVDRIDAAAIGLRLRSASAEQAVVADRSLTLTEVTIAAVWKEVLPGIGAIGPDDDFLALGGDSLDVTRMVTRCEALGLPVSSDAAFDGRSLAAIAQDVDELLQFRSTRASDSRIRNA